MTGLGAPPVVSVLVPTYERRDYVRRAVRSVFAQRFRNWELIVVDDGSTDGTEAELRAFGPRVRYLWQENKGVSAARNAGLRLAQGEIVAFLDSDDRWLPDHLETVVAMLDRHPEAVLACTSPRSYVAGREGLPEVRLTDALPQMLLDNFLNTSATAARRTHLEAVGGFDEHLRVLGDGELWLRLAMRGPFALLQRRTIIRQHTRGSLGEQGAESGEYLSAMEHIQIAVAQLAGVARSDRRDLGIRAEGKLRYCEALRALREGDEEAARSGLRDACLRLPELSSDPWFLDRRLKKLSLQRLHRLRWYETASRLWPDPRCDTALFLRVQAVLLAIRLRRFQHALTLLRHFPARTMPGFFVRNRSLAALLLSKRIQSHLCRGDDNVRGLPSR